MIFLLSLVRWSYINEFTVIHLISRLTSEENLSWKCKLSSGCLLLESARISFRSRQSLNSSITQVISGLQVCQRIRDESSTLLSKPLAPPHPFISLLFHSWIWSEPILESSRWDFWNKNFIFERKFGKTFNIEQFRFNDTKVKPMSRQPTSIIIMVLYKILT